MTLSELPWPRLLITDSFTLASNLSLSDWVIWLTITLFVCFLLLLLSAYWKASRSIKTIENALKDVKTENFSEHRLNISDVLKKKKIIGDLWSEFEETLVEVRTADNRIIYKNTLDAAYFFNTSTLAAGVSDSRLTAAVPGFLTAIGVLGTFLGLQQGLFGLQLGADASTEQLRSGIDLMIKGASVAFSTSVWGVFLSLIYNLIDKVVDRVKRNHVARLQMRVDLIFPRLTPEELLTSIATDTHQSRESLQGLAEKIGDKLQETMSNVSNDISHSLETALTNIMAPAIDRLVNQSAENGTQAIESLIGKFMESFGQQGVEQREALDKSSDKVNKSFEDFGASLKSFIERSELSDQKSEQRSAEMNKQITDIQQSMRSVIEESSQASLKANQQLSSTTESFVTDISTSVKEQLTVSTDLLTRSELLQKSFVESIDKHNAAAQSLQGASDTLMKTSEKMSNYGVRFEMANDMLAKSLQATIASSESLTERNQGIASELQRLHEQLTTRYEQHKNVQNALQATVETADSTFFELRSHQQEYAKLLRENVDSLAEQMTKLLREFAEEAQNQTADRLGHWNEQTAHYTTTMTNAMNTLAGVVDEMEGKLR